MKFSRVIMMVAAFAFGSQQLFAGFQYEIKLDQASYAATVGGQITVAVSLIETDLDFGVGPASSFAGLGSWNLGLTRTESSAGLLGTPAFADTIGAGGVINPSTSGLQDRISYIDFSAPFGTPSGIGTATRTLGLGTFTYSAANVGTGTISASTFTTNDLVLRTSGGGVVQVNLDSLPLGSSAIFGTATYTITAVPEPTSIALVGMAVAGFSFYRRRKA